MIRYTSKMMRYLTNLLKRNNKSTTNHQVITNNSKEAEKKCQVRDPQTKADPINNFIKFDIVRHDFDTIDKEPIVELKTEITHTLDEDPFKLYPQMDELKRKNFEEADQIAMSLGINIQPLPNTSSIKDANSWSSIDEDDDYE